MNNPNPELYFIFEKNMIFVYDNLKNKHLYGFSYDLKADLPRHVYKFEISEELKWHYTYDGGPPNKTYQIPDDEVHLKYEIDDDQKSITVIVTKTGLVQYSVHGTGFPVRDQYYGKLTETSKMFYISIKVVGEEVINKIWNKLKHIICTKKKY